MLLLLLWEILNENFDFRGGFDLISPVLNPSLLYDTDPTKPTGSGSAALLRYNLCPCLSFPLNLDQRKEN